MKVKDGKKFYFTLAVSMVIGNVIGTGIFFKNETIINGTNGNGAIILVSWLLGGMISLTTALSFVQISTIAKKDDGGIAQYGSDLISKKMGKFLHFNLSFFNMTIFTFAIAFFSAKFFMDLIGVDYVSNIEITLAIGIGIVIFYIFTQIYIKKFTSTFQIFSTGLKILPLLISSIVAIISIFLVNEESLFGTNNPRYANKAPDRGWFAMLLWSIPAIMFSFDGFLSASNIQSKLPSREKHIPLAFSVGMTVVTALYILNSVALINTGETTVSRAIVKFFGGNPNSLSGSYLVIDKIISLIILISGLGSANGFSWAWHSSVIQYIENYHTKTNIQRKAVVAMISSFVIWQAPFIIVTLIYKDQKVGLSFIDLISNAMAIFSYGKYTILIIYAVFKYIKSDIFKKKYKWFLPTALFSIATIFIALGYYFINEGIIKTSSNPSELIDGIFIKQYVFTIVIFLSLTLYFLGGYMIAYYNGHVIKKIFAKKI